VVAGVGFDPLSFAPAAARMPFARIVLARHGQSEFNRERRLCGQMDPPLSALGVQQSHHLARALAAMPLAAIFTSRLQRTQQSAAPVAQAHGLAVTVLPALDELSLGVLEGRFRDQRDPPAQALWQQRKASPASFRADGGESFAQLEARVLPALQALLAGAAPVAAEGGVALIVGHRETNRALLKGLLGWPTGRVLGEKLRNHLVYEIDPGARRVLRTISLRADDAGASWDGFRT
jgi:broad specificity phosphatase PhoE